MKEKEQFQNDVEKVIAEGFIALLYVILALLVFGPLVLAVMFSPWWLVAYGAYLVVLFLWAALVMAGRADDQNENH